jgi:hypothetical protein
MLTTHLRQSVERWSAERQSVERDLVAARSHAPRSTLPRPALRAYTVAEVLVGVLVLGILTFSLFGAFSSGLAVAELSRENLRATEVLTKKLETLRLLTWTQLTDPTQAAPSFSEWYDPDGTTSDMAGVLYHGVVSVTRANVPAEYSNDMRLVTVTLFWTNFVHGSASLIVRTRQAQTLVARNGVQNYAP